MSGVNVHLLAVLVVLGSQSHSTGAPADDLWVRDLPIPDGAKDATFNKRRGDVRFQVPKDFKSVGNYYAKQLTGQRWARTGRDNLQRNFWVQQFSKGKATLEVRTDSQDGGTEVRLTPKGMLWDGDSPALPGDGPPPTPKDIPIPKDALELEYSDFFETIEFQSPSNVPTVVEFLTKELLRKKWKKVNTEFDTETFVRMRFSIGSSALQIDVRSEEEGSEVDISTEGMSWEGMKAEIERAEREREAADDDAEEEEDAAEKDDAGNLVSRPPRKEKPKQGIDKLPKLPNEGTLVMDGKTHHLTHVIAYEIHEHGQWATRILATQRPIRLDGLLPKLRKTGTDNDEVEGAPQWPQPYLYGELDEDDKPWRLSLVADGTPGGATGSELTGTGLVEDGRARGTIALKEPGSFFDKVYTAELSFDVALLTVDSVPAKRLTDAPRLANIGKLVIGDRTYELKHAVAWEMKQFDEPMTSIVLSAKPMNMTKLRAAVGRKAGDDYFEFIPQVKLLIDAEENLQSINIWADNTSIGGNSGTEGGIVIEDGRVRGTVRTGAPDEDEDRDHSFDVSFDVDLVGGTAAGKSGSGKPSSGSSAPPDGLVADSHDGLPIPEGHQGVQSEGSRFRKEIRLSVAAQQGAIVDFYRRELKSTEWGEWKENSAESKVEKRTARLAFTGATGSLIVQLNADGKETGILLITRNTAAAKEAGVLPPSGKARLVIGNASEKAAVVLVSKREHRIAAGAGAEDPRTGLTIDVPPGNCTVEIRLPGSGPHSEKLKPGADETWGIIIGPTGECLALQIY